MCIRDRIYTYDVTHESDTIAPNANISRQPFVVYCSGIDARNSDVNIQSLSDVNILAAVSYTHLDVYKRQIHS